MSDSEFWRKQDEMPTILAQLAKLETTEGLVKELRAIETYLQDTAKLAAAHGVPLMIPRDISAKWIAFENELKSRGITIDVKPGEAGQ